MKADGWLGVHRGMGPCMYGQVMTLDQFVNLSTCMCVSGGGGGE